ncbi:MAG TPA: rod shape-determining protein MreD [Streptosporangiaceae bacterium]|nr:rod shape-determining protein MreD [Streptosporangiaceae bacterium]
MRRVTFAVVAILVAVVLQTVLLDRLPFPGGAAPDLVLVLVVTLALASGPMPGMLIGFGAGLALDVAPPASGLLGLSALVFCAVGYGCGRLRGPLERSAWLPLAAVALGVAAGEALYALVGMIFGDPDITWQSVRMVLPVAVIYDILLCPFVLYAVVRFGGYGGVGIAAAREPELTGRDLAGAGGVGLAGGAAAAGAVAAGAAVRDTRSGRQPRLRAAAGRQADAWIGGHPGGTGQAGTWVHRRRPLNLRARDGVAGSAASVPGRQGSRSGPARQVNLRLGTPRRGDGVLGGSLRGLLGVGLYGPPGGSGRESQMRGAAFRGSGPAGNGSSGGLSRATSSPRLPGRAFRGGPSALTGVSRGLRRSAPLRLRMRRKDGVLGGGVLGSRAAGGGGRGMSAAAFTAGRTPGAPGALRSGRGHGAVPRFRAAGRGPRSWRDRLLPGRRGSLPGGGLSGGSGIGGLGGRRRGFGGSRRAAFWRRRPGLGRTGTKRTGGLP